MTKYMHNTNVSSDFSYLEADYLPSNQDLSDKNDIEQYTRNANCKNANGKNAHRAYRRYMRGVKEQRLRNILRSCGYIPNAGWVEHDIVDGKLVYVGKYIKYPKNSNAQKFLKRYSNRKVRKYSVPLNGAGYKKLFDYWWALY